MHTIYQLTNNTNTPAITTRHLYCTATYYQQTNSAAMPTITNNRTNTPTIY